MLSQLASSHKVVGVKQSTKAVREGRAMKAFFACDADPAVLEPLQKLCIQCKVETNEQFTMQELGSAAQISVGAAVVVLLREK